MAGPVGPARPGGFVGVSPATNLLLRMGGSPPPVEVLAANPTLDRFTGMTLRTQQRTQRFVQLVGEAMRRTGLPQVELNPCDIWTPEEIVTAERMATTPLRLMRLRDVTSFPRDIRVGCPQPWIEYDYDLVWDFGGGRTYPGKVTLIAQLVLVGSLDQPRQRPMFASICHYNYRILRLDLPEAVRHVEAFIRELIMSNVRLGGTRCIHLLGRPIIGVG